MGDVEDITGKPIPKKIVLLPVIIASLIIFLILLRDGIFTSLNLSLASEFAIAFTVTISIFIILLLTKHFTATILFFTYITLPTFVAWFFFGMPGTSVPLDDAIGYGSLLAMCTFVLWIYIPGSVLGKNGSSSDDSRSGNSRSTDDSLYPYSSRAWLARERDLSSYNDNMEFYSGYHGSLHTGTAANVDGWNAREMELQRDQQREWERNHQQ